MRYLTLYKRLFGLEIYLQDEAFHIGLPFLFVALRVERNTEKGILGRGGPV
jgi:hypothetical protein